MAKANKCPKCGVSRLKGSSLCAYCLVGQLAAEKNEKEAAAEAARRLRTEVDCLRILINSLLRNAKERNQILDTLRQGIAKTKEKLRKAVEDEDDRMA